MKLSFDLYTKRWEGAIIHHCPNESGKMNAEQALQVANAFPCFFTIKAAIAIEIETGGKYTLVLSDPPVLSGEGKTFEIREKDLRAYLGDQTLEERVAELKATYPRGERK